MFYRMTSLAINELIEVITSARNKINIYTVDSVQLNILALGSEDVLKIYVNL